MKKKATLFGRVIFVQDVHAVIQKTATSAAPLWELAAWRTSWTRPYSAAQRSAARVGAVVHSSRSQSSLGINLFMEHVNTGDLGLYPKILSNENLGRFSLVFVNWVINRARCFLTQSVVWGQMHVHRYCEGRTRHVFLLGCLSFESPLLSIPS